MLIVKLHENNLAAAFYVVTNSQDNDFKFIIGPVLSHQCIFETRDQVRGGVTGVCGLGWTYPPHLPER